MELSQRLKAVAGLVTKGNVVCDVGCDHGYVSIYLLEEKISPKAIAMDVRSGPLAHAKEHIAMHGLDTYIETRLSDGMDALLFGEADTLILAGMGGRLMEAILTRGRQKAASMKEFIFQPQSELAQFRRFLRKNGYVIVQEDMVCEDDKFYPMMRAVLRRENCEEALDMYEGEGKETELWDVYGPLLLQERHPVLKKYLDCQREKLSRLHKELTEVSRQSEKGKKRLAELEQELFRNQRALDFYEEMK